MNYELAKQLREAGFPQKNFPVEFQCVCGTKNDIHHADGRCVSYLVPLSELIEACGDSFTLLERRTNQEGIKENGEKTIIPIIYQVCGFKDPNINQPGNFRLASGFTPEETVANLWLKLKKND